MKSYAQYCGLAIALDFVGGRWALLIVRELLTGAKRFTDLQDGLPGIATNLLTKRLRELEERCLVERQALPPPAASTVYVLTELGAQLSPAVYALTRWGGQFMRNRNPEHTFQPHWLVVALQALGLHNPSSAESLILNIDLPEGSILVTISDEGVGLQTSEPSEPDVVIRGAATRILGLASGELTWKDAFEAGLEVDGSVADINKLRDILTSSMMNEGALPGHTLSGKELAKTY